MSSTATDRLSPGREAEIQARLAAATLRYGDVIDAPDLDPDATLAINAPADLSDLLTEAAALRAELDAARGAVRYARRVFETYAEMHEKKCTVAGAAKGHTNREHAKRMTMALLAAVPVRAADQVELERDLLAETARRLTEVRDELRARVAELEGDFEWLEQHAVNVRRPARYGSFDLFWASPDPDEGRPSDLRERIARARAAETGGGE